MPLIRTLALILLAAIVALASFFWWAALDGAAPRQNNSTFDIAAYRALIAGDDDDGPESVRVEFVTNDFVPRFTTEVGAFGGDFEMTLTAFQLTSESGNVVIGGAVDNAIAAQLAQTESAEFVQGGYSAILSAMTEAVAIVTTHEHLDHIIGIARHPDPPAIAPALELTAEQIAILPKFAPPEGLHPELANLPATDADRPLRIAPGVVMHATPGHSPGSVVIYARRRDGQEYLFTGDIVWAMSNIENLKSKPKFLEWVMDDFKEDRPRVQQQIRDLHDLQVAEPDLIIVPSHDRAYLDGLVATGAIGDGFSLTN